MKNKRQRIEGMHYREMSLRSEGVIDEEQRLVKVSMSSEMPVVRRSFFSDPWVETLGHKRDEVDLGRLNNGASVHYNHSRTRADRIGVVESAKLSTVADNTRAESKNKKRRVVEGVVRISKRDDVDDVWTDIKDGVLRNVSVGYSINERKLTRQGKDGEPDEFRVTKWEIAELSFVDIPADKSVGVGRNEQNELQYRVIDLIDKPEKEPNKMFRFDANGNPLADTPETRAAILAGTATKEDGSPYVPTDEVRAALTVAPAPAPVVVRATPAPVAVDQDALRAEGVAAEQTRVKDINAIFAPFGTAHDEIRNAAVADAAVTVEATRSKLLAALGADSTPGQTSDALRIQSGEDGVDKFVRGAGIALAIRAGTVTDEERAAHDNSFAGFSLVELARNALTLANINSAQMSRMELVGRAFTTSDFPLILANQANKSMLKGYDEAPETWATWAQKGNLSDFKQASRVNLSTFNDLDLVSEDGEYKYGQFSENGENIQLATYGKLFGISRQAIINDDLGMFTRIPASMGRAASRTIGNLAYGVITSNPLMSDGIALFAGTAIGTQHGNLNLGGAAVISAASVGLARQGMARQTDSAANAVALNIRPKYLIVPMALEDTARVLMASEFNPSDVTSNNRAPNPARGTLEVVVDARLDADSSTRWYESAGQEFDTIEVAFLDGNESPMLEQQNGWSIDGTEFKVRIDAAAAPMDFRTWQRNDGV